MLRLDSKLSWITRGGGSASGIAGNSAEVQQFFDRLITLPSAPRQTLYANLIDGLVSDGVWAALDDLKIIAAANVATAMINLKSSSYLGTLIGTPTFTVDRGILGTASTVTCMDMGFNPANGVLYTRNDSFLGGWSLTATQINSTLFLSPSGDTKITIFPRWSDGIAYNEINGTGVDAGPAAGADCSGWFHLQRTGSNATELFRNNVSLGTSVLASGAVINETLRTAFKYQMSVLAAGRSMNSTLRTALFNRLTTYLTAVGAV